VSEADEEMIRILSLQHCLAGGFLPWPIYASAFGKPKRKKMKRRDDATSRLALSPTQSRLKEAHARPARIAMHDDLWL